MKHRLIFETTDKKYRIIELFDEAYNLENLKGDCFNPEVNTDIDAELLAKDERRFEQRVHNEGVFGYVLEKWNPEAGKGYEHIDSCWGFVGQYEAGAEDYEHYIVKELIQLTLEV
jgi:hypothetical protein